MRSRQRRIGPASGLPQPALTLAVTVCRLRGRRIGRRPGGSGRAALDARHRDPHRARVLPLPRAGPGAGGRAQPGAARVRSGCAPGAARHRAGHAGGRVDGASPRAGGRRCRRGLSTLEMVAAVPPDPLRGLRDDLLVMSQGRSRARSLLPSWYDALQNWLAVRRVSTVSRGRADRAGWTCRHSRSASRRFCPSFPTCRC